MFKRFFSREDKPETKQESNELNNLISSSESVPKGDGVKKLTDQVIEEVKTFNYVPILPYSHLYNKILALNLLSMLMKNQFIFSLSLII